MDAREGKVGVYVIRVKRASEGFIKREIISKEKQSGPVFVPTGGWIFFRLFLWAVRQLKILHHFICLLTHTREQ